MIVKVEVLVSASLARIWEVWTSPEHITRWYAASPDWHTPRATNDLKVGGRFSFRMEARDGSAGFDFWGTYTAVSAQKSLECELGDGRRMSIRFIPVEGGVRVEEDFETEAGNPPERQRAGWQAILDNFKRAVEAT